MPCRKLNGDGQSALLPLKPAVQGFAPSTVTVEYFCKPINCSTERHDAEAVASHSSHENHGHWNVSCAIMTPKL
jgi:hypothetical protein